MDPNLPVRPRSGEILISYKGYLYQIYRTKDWNFVNRNGSYDGRTLLESYHGDYARLRVFQDLMGIRPWR